MSDKTFEIEALNHLDDLNGLLNQRISSIHSNRNECFRAVLQHNPDNEFVEIEHLGLAIVMYRMAKAYIRKKMYKDFFTSLAGMSIFMRASIEDNKSQYAQKILSDFSKNNAIKRHKETYELKQQAKDYWRKHIDPNLSNPKAADLLIKVVPVSHRKLVEYVAEAKRENIRSAS